MQWPSLSDYNEAIQNPRTAFIDHELRFGEPELNQLGIPKPRTGRFACVYKIKFESRNYAVRCFSYEVKDQQVRYQAISKHLEGVKLPYLVEFEYLTDGIKVGGNIYPLLKMEWVHGDPLLLYIAKNVNNASALYNLAMRWRSMIEALHKNKIAHGDLQHGNIIVVNNDFRLVDYDGMFVPALAGKASNEIGEPNYQHPQRGSSDFGLYLDNFSEWIIYLALISIWCDPSLRPRIRSDDEHFLFKKTDYIINNPSSLLVELENHKDYNIRSLATLVHSFLNQQPKQIPTLIITPSTEQGPKPNIPKGVVEPIGLKSPPENKGDTAIVPDPSWVLSHILFSKKQKTFTGNLILPRLSIYAASLNTVILIIFGISYFSNSGNFLLFTNLPKGESSLMVIGLLIIAISGIDFIELILIYLYYRRNPTTIEMFNLKKQENTILLMIEDQKKRIESIDNQNRNVNFEENKRKKELQNIINDLVREKNELLNRVELELQKELFPLNSNNNQINSLEKKSISELNFTLGSEVKDIDSQISALNISEVEEIKSTVKTFEDNFIRQSLQLHSIKEAPIPGQKYSSRNILEERLIYAGIVTANDISYQRVDAVYGFGPARTQALVNWRKKLEGSAQSQIPFHVIDANKNAIKKRYSIQRAILEERRKNLKSEFAVQELSIRGKYSVEHKKVEREIILKKEIYQYRCKNIEEQFDLKIRTQEMILSELVNEYQKKHSEFDERLEKIKSRVVSDTWNLEKTRNELRSYTRISINKYFSRLIKG